MMDEFGYVDGFAHHSDLPEVDSFEHQHYDLIGADPGEEELWEHLMLDLNDEVNPYAT
jgi:hypothetical protein